MSDTYRYHITVNSQEKEWLEALLETGLYGRTIPEVMRRLVDRMLVNLIHVAPLTMEPKP